MRRCNACGAEKPLDEFPWHRKGVRHHKCKPCYALYFRRYRQEKPEMFKANCRRQNIRKYGIRPEDYDRLLAHQGGTCAIAGCEETARLHIDHDHETGEVRGILCLLCNLAMVTVDQPEKLVHLQAYKAAPPWADCKGAALGVA